MTHEPFTSWTTASCSDMSNRDNSRPTCPIPLMMPWSSRMSASTTSVPFFSPVHILAFNKSCEDGNHQRAWPTHGRGGNHGRFGSRLEPIGRFPGVEVGRRSGNGGQRTAAVERLGDMDWYLLLGTEELVVMKECERADARQQQPVGQSPAGERRGHDQVLRTV